MILFLCYFIFSRPRGQQTASAGEGGGEGGRGEGRRGEGGELVRGWAYVRADTWSRPRGCECFTPMELHNGCYSASKSRTTHRPSSVRPSVIVRVTTLLWMELYFTYCTL
jgi:hypothetical protein